MSHHPRNPFEFERQGRLAILTLAGDVERMTERDVEKASGPVLEALHAAPVTGMILDLSKAHWVNSFVLAMLFRFYKRVAEHLAEAAADGSAHDRFVIAGPSAKARELLDVTSLATLWPQYKTRKEAILALGGG